MVADSSPTRGRAPKPSPLPALCEPGSALGQHTAPRRPRRSLVHAVPVNSHTSKERTQTFSFSSPLWEDISPPSHSPPRHTLSLQRSLLLQKTNWFHSLSFSSVPPLHKIFTFTGTNFSFISSFSSSSKSPDFFLQNETATPGSSEHETEKTAFQSPTKCNILRFHSFDK